MTRAGRAGLVGGAIVALTAALPAAATPKSGPSQGSKPAAVRDWVHAHEVDILRVFRMPTLGGSVPMHLFPDVLGTTAMGMPIANRDDNQRAANENLRLQNLWDGTVVFATPLTGLGEAWP